MVLAVAVVVLAAGVAALMAWYYSPKRVEERWLRAEEKWLLKTAEWNVRANKWVEDHRTPAVEEWRAQVKKEEEARREREGVRWSVEESRKVFAAIWSYQGKDEQVREWVKREKELYEVGHEFNRRVRIWVDKGGDPQKVGARVKAAQEELERS
jgi:hypothetical protein